MLFDCQTLTLLKSDSAKLLFVSTHCCDVVTYSYCKVCVNDKARYQALYFAGISDNVHMFGNLSKWVKVILKGHQGSV